MEFAYLITARLERTEGKFATREELAEQLQEALADADPSSVDGGEGGSYDVQEWEVQEAPDADRFKRLTAVLDEAVAMARLHQEPRLEARLRKLREEFRITAPPARTGPSKREQERAAQIMRTVDAKARQRAGGPAVDGKCPSCGKPLRDLGVSPTAPPQHVGLCNEHGHWWFTPAAEAVQA